jgi:hypothetical protein
MQRLEYVELKHVDILTSVYSILYVSRSTSISISNLKRPDTNMLCMKCPFCFFYQATAQILMSVKVLKPVCMEPVSIPREDLSANVLQIMN